MKKLILFLEVLFIGFSAEYAFSDSIEERVMRLEKDVQELRELCRPSTWSCNASCQPFEEERRLLGEPQIILTSAETAAIAFSSALDKCYAITQERSEGRSSSFALRVIGDMVTANIQNSCIKN